MLRTVRDLLEKKRFYSIDDLPCSPNNILLSNFDRLNANDKVVLKIASVIGTSFSLPVLQELLVSLKLQSNIFNLEERISLASESTGLVLLDSQKDSTNTIYSFPDPMVRLSIYNLMLEAQRGRVHSLVGSIMERELRIKSLNDANSTQFIASLLRTSNHFCSSDNAQKKIEYHLVLSEYYLSVGNDDEFCSNFENLLLFVTGSSSSEIIDFCRTPLKSCFTDSRSSRSFKERRGSSVIYAAVEFSSLRMLPAVKPRRLAVNETIDPARFIEKIRLKAVGCQGLSVDKVAMWMGDIGLAHFRMFKLTSSYNCLITSIWNFDIDRNGLVSQFSIHSLMKSLETRASVVVKNSRSSIQDVSARIDVSCRLNIYTATITLAIVLGKIQAVRNYSIEALAILDQMCPISYDCAVQNLLPLVAVLSVSLGAELDSDSKDTFSFAKMISRLSPAWAPKFCGASLRERAANVAELLVDPIESPKAFAVFLFFTAENKLQQHCDLREASTKLKIALTTLAFIGEETEEKLIQIYTAWVLFVSGESKESYLALEAVKSFAVEHSATQLILWTFELQILIETFTLEFERVKLSEAIYEHANKTRAGKESIYGSSLCAFSSFIQKDIVLASLKSARICKRMASSGVVSTFIGGVIIFCGLFSAIGVLNSALSSTEEELSRDSVFNIRKDIVIAVKNYEKLCNTKFPGLISLSLTLNMKLADVQSDEKMWLTALQKTDTLLRESTSNARHFSFGWAFMHSERAALCLKLNKPTTFCTYSKQHLLISKVYDSVSESKEAFRSLGLYAGLNKTEQQPSRVVALSVL